MKRVLTVIMLALLLTAPAYAGQIFGRLKEGGRPIVNATFEVSCRDGAAKGTTDAYGSYSINVGRGKCTFKLYYRNQEPSFELYSYDSPLRYDFDVVLQSNGSLSLVRR